MFYAFYAFYALYGTIAHTTGHHHHHIPWPITGVHSSPARTRNPTAIRVGCGTVSGAC